MELLRARKPRARPRGYSRRLLIASVGPCEVLGRSKNASASSTRRVNVRQSVITSISGVGTPPRIESVNPCKTAFPPTRSDSP